MGGALALVGGYVQGKRTEKATRATEQRKLSRDSAREITAHMATLSGVARKHRDPNSLDLTEQGQTELWDCCSAMAHHARYISDDTLKASVEEAVGFLRPPPHFEEMLGRSVPGIVFDLEHWLGPMVQAHILNQPMPEEPTFLATYRLEYEAAEDMWQGEIESQEAYEAEEREKAKKNHEATQGVAAQQQKVEQQ